MLKMGVEGVCSKVQCWLALEMLMASWKRGSKNYISFLGYAESSQKFTEIKQVSACSIQVRWGINGDQCLEHFCSKGRISLVCQKVGEIP